MAKYVPGCIDYVLEGLIDNELTKPLLQTIPLTNLNMVTQLCNMLEVILTEDTDIRNPQVIASCFLVSLFIIDICLPLYRCLCTLRLIFLSST